jgi:hypothetical protein
VVDAVALEYISGYINVILDWPVLVGLRARVPAARRPPERLDLGGGDFHAVRQHDVVVVEVAGEGADLGDGEEPDPALPPLAGRLDERLPPLDDPGPIGRRCG